MPFPSIHSCLICEEVREETRRLSSLLGFYGILPHVEILIRDFKFPARVSLLFLGGQGEGQYQVKVRVLDSDGKSELESPPGTMVVEPNKRSNIALQFLPGIIVPGQGIYTVQLI